MRQPIMYKLIKEYPGNNNRRVGALVPYTTGEFSLYPEFWEPIYPEYKDNILTLEVVINKTDGSKSTSHFSKQKHIDFIKAVCDLLMSQYK